MTELLMQRLADIAEEEDQRINEGDEFESFGEDQEYSRPKT